jgi:hypothetical protein
MPARIALLCWCIPKVLSAHGCCFALCVNARSFSLLAHLVCLVQLEWTESTRPLPGLSDVLESLRAVDGISDIKLLRQATVPGVSPELELWLGKEKAEADAYSVAARAGSIVQELAVKGTLDKDELRAELDRALMAQQPS